MMTKDQIEKLKLIKGIAETHKWATIPEIVDEIIRIEESSAMVKNQKFDMYKYTCGAGKTDSYASDGLHYENGQIVSTDRQILVVLKNQEYDKELEGLTILKNGEKNQRKFPDYNAIKPANYSRRIKIDFSKFEEILKNYSTRVKFMYSNEKKSYDPRIKVGPVCLNLKRFKLFVAFMKHIGTDEILVDASDDMATRRAIFTENERGWGVLMPLLPGDCEYSL